MNRQPVILIDKEVPFLEGVFDNRAVVRLMKGAEITATDIGDADALIIRTRTECVPRTLEGSRVSFIGSATIGTDHIDTGYCTSHGIEVANAPGCNAGAVMQYVFTALAGWSGKKGRSLSGMTMGIIGVGNVGRRVAELARMLGFRVLLNDPPRAAAEGPHDFSDLPQILFLSDIVTLHVPLTADTFAMAGDSFFRKMKDGACFVNTSRGAVVNEEALRKHAPRLGGVILDVWNNEPDIDERTLGVTDIATPHIAGYSLEGKRNASQTVVRAMAHHFRWEDLYDFSIKLPVPDFVPEHLLFKDCFPIFVEDSKLRSSPNQFESWRSGYTFRREWTREQFNQLPQCLLHKI